MTSLEESGVKTKATPPVEPVEWGNDACNMDEKSRIRRGFKLSWI
jgi:hypothetical protein